MVFSKQKVSLRHLLILLYVLIVVLLIALLVHERQRANPSFTLSQVSAEKVQNTTVLSAYGEEFHSGIRGVFAKSLVNEDALLWRQFSAAKSAAIDVKDDLALVSSNNKKLISLRLHDGKAPELLDSIELPDNIRQIKIVGDQALVGMHRHAGIIQIDLKDPRALKLVRHYPLAGFVLSMVADRSIVYYADFYQGVGRIDLATINPVPEQLATLESPWRIALQGNRLAVGTVKDGVHLFDLTKEGRLVETGHLDYSENVRGVAFTDEVLAVALADSTLHLLDLSTWPSLNDSAQITLPGRPLLLERIPGQAELAVGLVAGGIALVDAHRPATATVDGLLRMPRTFLGIKVQTGKIYGVSHEGVEGFSLDKIAGDESLSIAADGGFEPEAYRLRSWNDHVYGSANHRLVDFGETSAANLISSGRFMAVVEDVGVGLFEQRENGDVQRIGSVLSAKGAKAASFRGNYLYIVHQDGLQILSGARPEELAVMSDLRLPGQPRQLNVLASGFLLIVTRDNGVLVVDVNDPRQPVLVASLVLPRHQQSINFVDDVLIDGSLAYISYGAGGVHVVDMSSPSQPELLQIVDTPGDAGNMALYDNLLLVADGPDGIFMIDVKSRLGALPIGTLPTPLRVAQIAVADGSLIVSSYPGGTMRLPLPRRTKDLQFVNSGEVLIDMGKVEKGQYVYLYDERTSARVAVSVP